MGKMTDALRKAGLLKDEDRAAAPTEAPDVEAAEAKPAPEPATKPAAKPAPKRPDARPTSPPKLRIVVPDETPTRRSSPVPRTEPVPARPAAESSRHKMTSLIFPSVEPAPASAPVVREVEPRPVLPEVEPTPVEANRIYLSTHYSKDDRTADEFRALKTRLAAGASPAQVILVASASPGEGKTMLATNLALSFAHTYGEKVVLVDANVARPKIGSVLELGETGLGDVVRGGIRPEEAAARTDITGLWAVSAGRTGDRSEGLLDRRAVKGLLDELRRRFTRVVMELPAESDSADALAPAGLADVVLVPVLRSRTRRRALRRLIERLRDRGARRIHCVFVDV
ncbi:MAG TPA: hypothetical protein VMY39_04490 [Planctomycetota bacterium]|nr:hypothetical protein [Planctomycetota bacterium]